ncbi:ribonucleoside-diphosphate reductase subunit alpha [bacterium]|jgi:ribonucleoside-diphosphate reductase alpha chain|nr:ribonucleoside-diphosphate reductase subunit alpha [bacterium]MBT3850336.1 ribonucleoside-diphosphate reductase subunit alpha [bacterium]|tara:strand:- start:4591 stop:7380 length:2790 start_codon:yes stop_codon:yes gene_type:complete
MNQIEEMLVVKRSGELVKFDSSRIINAVNSAINAGNEDHSGVDVGILVDAIEEEVRERFIEFYPNVENIQDIVEKHLIRADLFNVARRYIIYRAERTKEREVLKEKISQKAELGKLKIRKRDGLNVLFNPQKIRKTVERACKDYSETTSIDAIVKELTRNIFDGATTEDIEKALILSSTAFIERDPHYSKVSSRIFLQRLYKEAMQVSVNDNNLDDQYKQTFIDGVRFGVKNNYLDSRLSEFDLEKLSNSLIVERDSLFEFIGIQTLYERYILSHDDRKFELPQAFWMRVAMGMALNESNKDSRALEFYNKLSSLEFVSSTPTLFHSGTPHPQLSSCYLTTVSDDLSHIFKCVGDNAQLSKWSGGLGNDWTSIRATGSQIKSTNVESQGVIPFLKIANDVTVAINRSGKRRGATCAYLETWHLDIEDFLDLRRNTGDDRRRTHDMNTSNWIPDLFMKRVIANEDWTLFSPEEVSDLHDLFGSSFEKAFINYEADIDKGKIKKFKKVKAADLWKKMLTRIFETGHPWITFKDACNVRSPQDHVGVVHSSNLCTEITLNTSPEETAVCNLGSINLSRHIVNGKLDRALLEETIKTAIRMLDNVIDLNFYPTIEAKNSNFKHRPIGLGVMGLQDALFKVDLPFESPKALNFSDQLMEFISYNAIDASSELARERGAYETFKGSKWDRGIFPLDTLSLLEQERNDNIEVNKITSLDWDDLKDKVKENGMRNSNTMAIAPTATISNIAGCFPCIEPIYKNIYVKSNISGEFTVVNSYLVEDLKKLNLWSKDILEKIKYFDGNLDQINEIPEELRLKHKEAFGISPMTLLKHTAVRGKWIDQSQSHNIFMQGVSGKLLSEIYIAAWKLGLKTTYYLRTLAATQIEKSTLDAGKFGYTQKREYKEVDSETDEVVEKPASEVTSACSIMDPDCEACQ